MADMMSIEEIAKELNIDRERVRQILFSGLAKLKHPLFKKYFIHILEDYNYDTRPELGYGFGPDDEETGYQFLENCKRTKLIFQGN